MSLIHRNNNFHCFPVLHSKCPRSSSPLPFEEILAVQLQSLLPVPTSRPSVPLPWFSRFAHLLASTLVAAGSHFGDDSSSEGAAADEDYDFAAHLDAGVNLLDACNAVSAEIARLRSALLPLHLALRLLSDDEVRDDGVSERCQPWLHSRIRRARVAIEEWEASTRHDFRQFDGDFVRRLTPMAPPWARTSSVRKVSYAVEALSKLVMEAVVAALAGGGGNGIERIELFGEWPWAEAFNEVQAAISDRLGKGFADEAALGKLRTAVGKLRAAMDVGSEEDEAAKELSSALMEAKRMAAELGEGLDRLGDGVAAVFSAAIKTRDVALNRLRRSLLCGH